MNSYEDKQEQRRARLEAAADRAKQESASRFNAARSSIEHIPPGQPILVGHHSERRHRADLARHDRNMRAGIDADNRAAELARRADSVGSAGISSDDPEAVRKLKLKLAGLETAHEQMKLINAAWRKAGKPKADNAEAWAQISATPGAAVEAVDAARLSMARDFMDRAPFSYHISNSNQNIKQVRERIAILERNATRETSERQINGVRIVANAEANRLQLIFPGKPPEAVRKLLKRYGFRWAPSEGAWQRHLPNHPDGVIDWLFGDIAKVDGGGQ
jgi:hypothetical protein